MDRVNALAIIVAESSTAAWQAGERIEVEYESLPAVTSAQRALAEGAQKVWDHLADNVCVDFQTGDEAAVAAAFAGAAPDRHWYGNRVRGFSCPVAALWRLLPTRL